MKSCKFLAITLLASLMSFAYAQTAAIKDIPADGDTTITVSKGKTATSTDKKFEIVDGSAEISGEPEVLQKAARSGWKQACADWKAEIKDLNKENQVIAMSCNSPKCDKNEASQTVCRSTGNYKLKVKLQ